MICKRCGLDVEPVKLEQGIFDNVYKCPTCDREFGGSTLLKKAGKVAIVLITLGLFGEADESEFLS